MWAVSWRATPSLGSGSGTAPLRNSDIRLFDPSFPIAMSMSELGVMQGYSCRRKPLLNGPEVCLHVHPCVVDRDNVELRFKGMFCMILTCIGSSICNPY